MMLTCLECDEPVEKLGDLCPEHAPLYADNDNQGHASELEDDCG